MQPTLQLASLSTVYCKLSVSLQMQNRKTTDNNVVSKRESRRLHFIVACVRHPLSVCEIASWLSTKLSATDELSQPVVISIQP